MQHWTCVNKLYFRELTHWKMSFMWSLSTYFNWTPHNTSVVTLITFFCVLNMESTGIPSSITTKLRSITLNVYAIFLPLKMKVITYSFNSEDSVCSSGYWLALWMLSDLRRINWEGRVLRNLTWHKYLHYCAKWDHSWQQAFLVNPEDSLNQN